MPKDLPLGDFPLEPFDPCWWEIYRTDPAAHWSAVDAIERDRAAEELDSLSVGSAVDQILLRCWENNWKQTRRGE